MNRTKTTPRHAVALRGQILFLAGDEIGEPAQSYQVLAGEVALIRNGRFIDLMEAGEIFEPSLWENATAIAWTDCVLSVMPVNTQRVQPARDLLPHGPHSLGAIHSAFRAMIK